MKNTYLFISLSLFLITCDEPKVKPFAVETVSAFAQDDGSVLLTGRIASDGGSAISTRGFGMGTEADPGENEKIVENAKVNGDLFTSSVSDFDETKKYYFRAFARSATGISTVGKIIMVENIKAIPVVAPCSPALNTVNHGVGGGDKNFKSIGANTTPIGWSISTSANGIFYKINFEKKPSTGIYTTVEDFKPEGKGVYILLGDGLSDYVITGGAKVYVNKLAADKWDIVVCEAPFVMGLYSKLSMRLQVQN